MEEGVEVVRDDSADGANAKPSIWVHLEQGADSEEPSNSFLAIGSITIVLSSIFAFAPGNESVFKGQSLAIWTALAGTATTFLVWLRYRRPFTRGIAERAALASLLGIWVVSFVVSLVQSTGFSYAAFALPAILLMVLAKSPRSGDVLGAAMWLGASVVVAGLVSEIYSFATGKVVIQDPEFVYSWWGEVTGTTKRWVGPFVQENFAGPIAAFVFVFAVTRRGWYRWVVGLCSIWMVVASTSSTAVLGVFVGLGVLGIFTLNGPLARVPRGLRVAMAVGGLIIAGVALVLRDPTFNGRTTVWSSYLDVWQASPWGGVGTSGIEAALRSGQIPLYWTHAHNVPLDLLTRYGALGLALILFVYVLSAWGGLRAAAAGVSWPLAIVLMFIVIGLMEVPGNWLTLTIPVLWLILAILASSNLPRATLAMVRDDRGVLQA